MAGRSYLLPRVYMIEERVSNTGILCIRCMRRVTWLPVSVTSLELHHPHLDWSGCTSKLVTDTGSHVTPRIHLIHSMPVFDTLSSIIYLISYIWYTVYLRSILSLLLGYRGVQLVGKSQTFANKRKCFRLTFPIGQSSICVICQHKHWDIFSC